MVGKMAKVTLCFLFFGVVCFCCLHLGMNFVVTERRQYLDEMKVIIFGKRSDGF